MSGEHQLERSVLEGKERDELHAIADALGVKPGSRTKKADLVDKILQATGVKPTNGSAPDGNGSSSGEAPAEKPKRTRATKKTADAPAEAASDAPAEKSDESTPRRSFAARAAALAAETATDPAAQVTVTDIATPDDLVADVPAGKTGFAGKPRENSGGNDGGGSSGGGGRNERNQNRGGGDRNQGDRNQGDRGGTQGGGGGGGRNQGGNQDRGNQLDAGNKRGNRRRRGRDRFDGMGSGGSERDMPGYSEQQVFTGDPEPVAGLLDLADAGFGLIRVKGYLPSAEDIYVPVAMVKRLGLRKGDRIVGTSRPAGPQEKYGAILDVETVSEQSVEEAKARPKFDDLTPLFPDEQLKLEMPGDSNNMVARIVDLMSPIGKGQRGLIVSPPKAGKTTVLKQIATSIEANNKDVHLIVLLVDERPEEV
ncbi:MAG: transcription termination factor Rho, partial [Actinomycetota bacterium]